MIAAHTIPEVEGSEFVWDGRSSILFALVAGVSLGLLSGGSRTPAKGTRCRVARIVALRALVLVLLGIGLAAFETPIAIILDTYGFLFVVALPLLYAPRWLVAVVAAAAALLGPPLVDALTLQAELATGTARVVLDSPWAYFPESWLTGVYPAPVWLAYLAAGVLIARCDLRRARTQIALVAVGAVTAVVVYLGADALGQPVEAHSDGTAEVLASGGLAVAIVGLLVWLTASTQDAVARTARRLLYPLSAAGSMPLTLYSAQIVVIWLVVENVDYEGGYLGWQTVPLFFAVVLPALLLASLWRLRFEQGPLEWLLSRITGQRPWRRRARPRAALLDRLDPLDPPFGRPTGSGPTDAGRTGADPAGSDPTTPHTPTGR